MMKLHHQHGQAAAARRRRIGPERMVLQQCFPRGRYLLDNDDVIITSFSSSVGCGG